MKILACEINFKFSSTTQLIMYFILSVQNVAFSELVVNCQQLIRRFANEQLKRFGIANIEAKLRATSCVSQRDIQVFSYTLL